MMGFGTVGSIAVNFNYATITSPSALRLKLVTAPATLSGNASVMGLVPVYLGDRSAGISKSNNEMCII